MKMSRVAPPAPGSKLRFRIHVAPRVHYLPSMALRVCATVLALALAAEVDAQESTPLDRFQGSVVGDAQLSVPGAFVEGEVRPAFSAFFMYANAPLVIALAGTNEEARAIVEHHVMLRVQAAISLFERALIHVDLPATLYASGDAASSAPLSDRFAEPESALEDLRIGARVALVKPDEWIPGASFGLWVFAPTGRDDAYTSAGTVRATPHMSLGAVWGPVTWTAFVGRTFYPTPSRSAEGGLLGSDVNLGAGATVKVDRFAFGLESTVGISTERALSVDDAQQTVNAEALATARAEVGPVTFSLAGGPGLTRAPGTPRVRLLSGVSVAFDAIARRDPLAPVDPVEPAEPKPAGPSELDALKKLAAEDPSVGAPVTAGDADLDGIADEADACPRASGPTREDPKTTGCPDTDGDAIVDPSDACPRTPGAASNDASKHGCPTQVVIEGDKIALLQPILFETNSAELSAASQPLLQQIADTLIGNPGILRVAVDGHTDNRGLPRKNLELSRARAVAVVRWLNAHGVDELRTEARGFGAKAPITTNFTDEGRLKNRRVEIVILRRAEAAK